MRRVEFDPAAESEVAEAAAYLEQQRRGYGDRFLAALRRAIERIDEFPHIGRASRRHARTFTITEFKYDLVYRIDDELIFVFAVAHHARRPAYWRSRLR